jgi:hypothetical protein
MGTDKEIVGDIRAEGWLELILSVDHPLIGEIREHVRRGTLFDDDPVCPTVFGFEIPDGAELTPLSIGATGAVCELGFETNGEHEIWFRLGTDARGYFAGFDVEYGPIAYKAVPADVEIGKLIQVHGPSPTLVDR